MVQIYFIETDIIIFNLTILQWYLWFSFHIMSTLFSNLLITFAFELEPSPFGSPSEYVVVKPPHAHITHHIQPFLSSSIANRFLNANGRNGKKLRIKEDKTEIIVSLEKEKLKSSSLMCNRNGGKWTGILLIISWNTLNKALARGSGQRVAENRVWEKGNSYWSYIQLLCRCFRFLEGLPNFTIFNVRRIWNTIFLHVWVSVWLHACVRIYLQNKFFPFFRKINVVRLELVM